MVEVVFVQCNLVDNKYQQMSEVVYNFMANKSDAYFLNAEPNNFLEIEFDKIVITFAY